MTSPEGSATAPTALIAGRGAARRLSMPILAAVPNLLHAFTVKGSKPAVALRDLAGGDMPLVTLRQVHGALVHRVEAEGPESRAGAEAPASHEGDALVTSMTRRALAVYVADCVPALVCDPRSRVLAAVHAGWRGTVAGVLARTIDMMRRDYGARPEDLRVALGPAIGPCCFEVGEEVVERLLGADPGAIACVLHAGGGAPRVDLIEANRRQALASGVSEGRIQATGLCTRCETDLLESYRRSGPGAGRMAGLIAWES